MREEKTKHKKKQFDSPSLSTYRNCFGVNLSVKFLFLPTGIVLEPNSKSLWRAWWSAGSHLMVSSGRVGCSIPSMNPGSRNSRWMLESFFHYDFGHHLLVGVS